MIEIQGTPPVIDENYPYLDKSLFFRLMSTLSYLAMWTAAFVACHVRFALRIEGRRLLRKHRKLFKNGAMTVSNHVLFWDFVCVCQAVRYHRLHFPAWPGNLGGPQRNLIRWTGGIPIPEGIHAFKYFLQAFDELHLRKKWFHSFPEGSWWNYHQPIRPFKKGTFNLACRYNIPVIPLAFSYRPARGLYKLFKGKYPLITLRIGDPILPDSSLSHYDAAEKLREAAHRKMCELAGITNNPYPCKETKMGNGM
jgi:1-acyl-sn-glycerol-3-phosphate acyltransferase